MISPSSQQYHQELSALARNLSPDSELITDFSNHEQYLHDATVEIGQASALLFAANESDIITTLQFCNQHDIPVVPRGAGTGLSGGCVPLNGAIVLSTEHLTKLTIDREKQTAFCGPGVITKQLQDEAAKHKLAYPPDPASYEESTLGGNVAENAGGLRCVRFGVTKDYIIGLKAITIDGSLITTGVYNQNESFNIGDLLIGSEGTLAIITEIAIRLIPAFSIATLMMVTFDLARNAAQTVTDITRNGIVPTVLEYIDGDAAACSNEYAKTDLLDDAAAILIIETDATQPKQVHEVEQICRKNHAIALRSETDQSKAESIWKVRRNISKAITALAKIRISEDVAVPNSKLPELVAFVDSLNASSPLRINCFGHAGDGNLHINFLAINNTEEEKQALTEEIPAILDKALKLGGTLSGEHGIGLAKRKYLAKEFDQPTLRFMTRIKDVFDPAKRLNPGKIFT